MKNFNIFGIHWKLQLLGEGGVTKNQDKPKYYFCSIDFHFLHSEENYLKDLPFLNKGTTENYVRSLFLKKVTMKKRTINYVWCCSFHLF